MNKTDQIKEQFYGDTPEQFLERVNLMISKAEQAGAIEDSLSFETEVENNYGCENAHLVLYFRRPETEVERLARENDDEVFKQSQLEFLRNKANALGYTLYQKDD